MRRHRWVLVLALLVGACGSKSASTTSTTTTILATTTTTSSATFEQRVQGHCLDIDEHAYQRVMKVFPPGAASTPAKQAEEQRIRAEATDELVKALRALTPPADLTPRWDAILAGLTAYADYSRAAATAVEAGKDWPDTPEGLDDFRNLELGGKCNDWLDMN